MLIVNKGLSLYYITDFAKILCDWTFFYDNSKKHCFAEINVLITENLPGRAVYVRIQKMDPKEV